MKTARLNPRTCAVVIAAAIFLGGCSRTRPARLQGYIEGEYIYITSPLSGALQKLSVQRGDRIKPGSVVFTLDGEPEQSALSEAKARLDQAARTLADLQKGRRPEEIVAIEAQVKQARAAQSLAEVEFQRQTQLFASGSGTQRELDAARSNRDQAVQRVGQAEAELATGRLGARSDQIAAAEANSSALASAVRKAEWELAQKTQAAPQAGQVFDTFYREGEWIAAGHPVAAILPPQNIKLRTFVPEGELASIQVGNTIRVWLDGAGEPVAARVSFISPQAEYTPPVIYSQTLREKLVFMVEAQFSPDVAEKLHPGQPVDVSLTP